MSADLISIDPQGERQPMRASLTLGEKTLIYLISALSAALLSYGTVKTVQASHTEQIEQNRRSIQLQGETLRSEMQTAIQASEVRLSKRLDELVTQVSGISGKLDSERDRREADTKAVLRAVGRLEGRNSARE